jgi:hypothetical protein
MRSNEIALDRGTYRYLVSDRQCMILALQSIVRIDGGSKQGLLAADALHMSNHALKRDLNGVLSLPCLS